MMEGAVANIRRGILLGVLYLVVYGQSFAQSKQETLTYEIVVLGMKIGNMVAQKSFERDSLAYKVDSQVKFWFFGNVELKFNTKTHFLGGKLVKATSDSKTNRGNFASRVRWNGQHYQVNAETYKYENDKPLKGPLSWSSTKMFFHEPSDQDVFLSEVYGVSSPIKKIEPGVYEIDVEGNTNTYYYVGGRLEKIVLESPIKNYQVRLVK